MNPIEVMLKHIRDHIPPEIIHAAFQGLTDNGRYTIDYAVTQKIILDDVLLTCSLFSGKIKQIELKEEYLEKTKTTHTGLYGDYSIYRIPPEAREFQDILFPIDISYPGLGYRTYEQFNVSGKSLFSLASEAVFSFTGEGEVLTPRVFVLNGNIIQLKPPQPTHIDWIVSCILSYDQSFSNISPGLLVALREMALYAAQKYIYNNLILKIDQGLLVGGKELGKFADIVESYADADEKFNEAVRKFRGLSMMDKDKALELIGMMF